MVEILQILADMNELNERVQNAEARTMDVGREQELARSHAGASSSTTTGAGDRHVCVEVFCVSRSKVRTTSGENRLACFARSWSGRFFDGALAEIY